MTEKLKRRMAERLRELLDAGTPKKRAMFMVQEEIRVLSPELPRGRSTIYRWCDRFGVNVR